MAARKSFLLRIDPALWADVERLAQAELRSVNAQIEYLLREALARRRTTGSSRPRRDDPHVDGADDGDPKSGS